MRFPRALSIRDDLSIEDCMTASGMSVFVSISRLFTGKASTAVLESLRSEKKRKMEKDAGFVVYWCLIP
jgi:DNA ligase-4